MTCCFNTPELPDQMIDDVPYTLYSDDGVYMVKVINVCDWLDHTYGEDWDKHPDYETSGKDLMAWCEKNNSYYYARGREDFSLAEAVRLSIEADQDIVVVEDLS